MGNINTSRDWEDDMLEPESSDDDIFEQLGPDNEDGYYVVCWNIDWMETFYLYVLYISRQCFFVEW